MKEKYAIIIDAAFLKKKLQRRLKKKALVAADIVGHCENLKKSESLKDFSLFRIYYYDCPPYQGQDTNPFSQQPYNFSNTVYASWNQQIMDKLELEPAFAIRKGHLVMNGWELGSAAIERMRNETPPILSGSDFIPDLRQKQVDMKIGLDIAWLSIKKIVDKIVLITGDQDFIPVMKFARKEGVIVYLNHFNHGISRELKVHSDYIIDI